MFKNKNTRREKRCTRAQPRGVGESDERKVTTKIDLSEEHNWISETRTRKEEIDANRFRFDGKG